MKSWELTRDKVILIYLDEGGRLAEFGMESVGDCAMAVATEAQKKLVRWDNELCPDHHGIIYRKRRNCPVCQQAKLEWAEEE